CLFRLLRLLCFLSHSALFLDLTRYAQSHWNLWPIRPGLSYDFHRKMGRREFPQPTSEGSSSAERRPVSNIGHALIFRRRSINRIYFAPGIFAAENRRSVPPRLKSIQAECPGSGGCSPFVR